MKINSFYIPATGMAGILMFLTGCKGNNSAQQTVQAPELAVITLEETNSNLETAIPATLEGENDVEIRPQVTGFLTKVHV